MKTGSRATRAGWPLAGYVVLTLVMTYPLILRFASAIPGDSFDGWQNYWNLWWVKTAVLEQHTHPWFTDVLYHPTGVGLLFHTLNAFNGFTFLPVQLAFGLIPAYNAVVVFSFAIGGLGAYLLARQVLGPGSSRLAAFVAGVVFTFSPFHVAHLLGHMQLIALEWIPFFALYLLRVTRLQQWRVRDAGMAVVFLTLVALCDWYYVMYCAILSAIVVVWRAAISLHRSRRDPGSRGIARTVLPVVGIWAAWALLFSPLLAPMVREALQFDFMEPDPQQFRVLSADLLAFVTPQEFHPVWGAWAQARAQVFTSTVSEHQVFAGFTVLLLAGLGLFSSNKRRWMLWALAAFVFFVLALGPVLHVAGQTALLPGGGEIPLPYQLLQDLPFMSISRSISRFDVMVMLALGILAAGGLSSVAQRFRLAIARAVSVSALALVLFEFLPAPYPMSPPDTPDWYGALAADPRSGAVLNLPVNWDRPWYLLYQTVHEKPLTAAYISREDPRTLIDRAPVLQNFRHLGSDVVMLDSAEQGRQVLADLDVRWVVLDRYKMPGGAEREVTERAAAALFAAQAPVFEDERLTVYEVTPPDNLSAYPILGVGWEALDAQDRTRGFAGAAPVIIQAPEAGKVTLRVETAPDSAPLDLPQVAGGYELRAQVQAGANEIMLRTTDPGARAVVARLRVIR